MVRHCTSCVKKRLDCVKLFIQDLQILVKAQRDMIVAHNLLEQQMESTNLDWWWSEQLNYYGTRNRNTNERQRAIQRLVELEKQLAEAILKRNAQEELWTNLLNIL